MSEKRPSTDPQKHLKGEMRMDLRLPLIIAAAEGLLLLTLIAIFAAMKASELHTILSAIHIEGSEALRTDITARVKELATICIGAAIFYAVTAGAVLLAYSLRYAALKNAEEAAARMGTDIYRMFRTEVDVPYAVVNADGVVRVINAAMQSVVGYRSPVCAVPLGEFCPGLAAETVFAAAHSAESEAAGVSPLPTSPEDEDLIVRLSGRRYRIEPYPFNREGRHYYFLLFRDVEDLLTLREACDRSHVVFAYIKLDNLQELTQFVRANYRATANLIEETLSGWVTGMGGMLHEYDRDRYLAVFTSEMLEECIRQDFDILERIMNIRAGDNSFPVSVSIGIADIDGTIKEREAAASMALDMALQRGGNQVALQRRGVNGLSYFGGAHKTMESNTSISSRVSAHLLERRLAECDRVLIMPHANPDFDALGSAVGAYRLCRSMLERAGRASVPVHIVTNLTCDTFKICRDSLRTLPEYDSVFVDKAAAQQMVTTRTMLVITDVNNPFIFECPQLAAAVSVADGVSSIAVIDHHRLVSELPFTPFLHYIEATKSSASEIVAEILQQSEYADTLAKEEANLLLAGIMLDTHNFTRSAGAQTFEVTYYLYSRSAHTEVAREFFNERMDELLVSGDFDAHARIYEDVFAITWLSADHTPSPDDRIAASKAADKLLGLRGVEASFAFAAVGSSVAVSARSKGRVNVQLIMEKLAGGGHFDMAGAQVPGGVEEAYAALTAAIDEYKLQFPELFKKAD